MALMSVDFPALGLPATAMVRFFLSGLLSGFIGADVGVFIINELPPLQFDGLLPGVKTGNNS
jgi:hypothetical protein